jgi:hypothetical protein
VTIDRTVDIAGPQALVMGSSAWSGSLVRAVDFAGTRSVRLVGGAGGWRNSIPAQQYASPVGVPTATVLADAAAVAHEIPPVVDPTLQPTVGPAFVRQAGLASLVLDQVCGDQWWMDPTGTVQTSIRIPSPIVSAFSVQEVYGSEGRYTIQTEAPQDWSPGSLFAGPTVSGTISRTMWAFDGSGLRLEVLVS